ncbi:hypothetical protein J2T12_001147 [Paenibacillus anaericanus]|uniref:nucleotidyltransferase family protein n=1 Tax=Paenibacillus anaericanus TaxID=170367 RepID=UPI00278B2791|nr:nucleotidyltransferase family protein [Paenibacillus anaericanus]MDQ0087741.1 hypothetical protein [Paenibacillus anaericanus]
MENKERLLNIVEKNPILIQVFERVQELGLESYYVGAGCIVQTVWNDVTNRPLNYGISDIDIVYFNDTDLSYRAEDEMITRGKKLLSDIPIQIDMKNQARVHLWYEEKFGTAIKPYKTIEAAIDTWPTTATSLGLRLDHTQNWTLYAPFGLDDLFNMVIRPNKSLISEAVYNSKVKKWTAKWPELEVVKWDQE